MSVLYPCVYCTEDGYCKKYSDEEVTTWCVQGPCKDEKPTNADRIRAMTDEELMLFLRDESVFCAHRDERTGGACVVCNGECGDCLTDWLKSPVEVDE